MQYRGRAALLVLVLASVAFGCGGDDGATPTAAIAPTTVPQAPPSVTSTPAPRPTNGDEPRTGPFEIVTADGLILEAERFGVGDEFVVLAHMRPADMSSWFSFAGLLGGEGYSAITFNFRGYGNSEGAGFAVDVDVVAAVDAAFALGATRVFVVGASMGGTGAIAAAGRRDLAGVITLSAPDRFEGVDAAAGVVDVAAPILLIAAEDDAPYAGHAEELGSSASGRAEVMILPGRKHGTDLFLEHSETLTARILEFLQSA